jgi:hypothetical protein
VKLETVRTDLYQILRNTLADDVGLVDSIPDSIAPPSVFIAWADPWVTPSTMCFFNVNLSVIVVAQRIEPGGQYGILEELVSIIMPVLKQSRDFLVKEATSPYPMTLGGVNYLACSVNLSCDIGE